MHTEQENLLEKTLRLAADEPAHRPDFIRTLLGSTIFVIGNSSLGEGTHTIEVNEKLEIKNWTKQDGSLVIPFFSSIETLQKAIEKEESYLALPAKSLFENTQGANLVLNPKSPYGKEFFAEEVKNILLHGATQMPASRTMEIETKILLGQPSNYPKKMVESLSILLEKHLNVSQAFVATMHDPSTDEKPCLIVGIEAGGDIESTLRDIGNVVTNTVTGGEAVDLFRISKDEAGLSEYFLTQTKPFYERKRGSKLRAFFGI